MLCVLPGFLQIPRAHFKSGLLRASLSDLSLSFLLNIIFKFCADLAGCHTPIPLPKIWGLLMSMPGHIQQHLAASITPSVC